MNSTARLRIAFVADSLHSHSGGGILSGEFVVERLRRDHDVVAVASDGDEVLPKFQLPLRAMREMGFVMAKPDRVILARAFAHVDVVHLQFPFWLSYAALEEARRLRLPVVAAFHVQPENLLQSVGIYSPWLNNTLYRALVRHFYNRVDAVLCPTAFAEQKLRDHGLKTPTAVISNGVPPDVARAMAANPSSTHRSSSGRFFILAVGRFAAEKHQDVIIEAVRLSRHRDRIRLVLSGWGPREDELRNLASRLPNGAEIGFLSREQLVEDYGAADLFVHAGEVELEGMSVLESMSAGLPALIANAPESAASTLALNEDFSFAAGDAPALAAKIDALIDDPSKLAAARELYRERAHQFDFNASVEKLVALYRSVIDGAASRRNAT
jgi:glycosyltransferase involved in cell wall biosynthesis